MATCWWSGAGALPQVHSRAARLPLLHSACTPSRSDCRKFFGENTTDWGAVAASILITAPVLVFFVLAQRNLGSGLAAGSVKD
jgi:ABC-type glycerol-3-phosphate transport system permease component